jgi:hypothetical protein
LAVLVKFAVMLLVVAGFKLVTVTGLNGAAAPLQHCTITWPTDATLSVEMLSASDVTALTEFAVTFAPPPVEPQESNIPVTWLKMMVWPVAQFTAPRRSLVIGVGCCASAQTEKTSMTLANRKRCFMSNCLSKIQTASPAASQSQ